MESWRTVWRTGFVPVLSSAALEALAEALREDDPRLVQLATTYPLHNEFTRNKVAEAGCALGFAGAVASGGFGAATVDQCQEFFARVCFEADQRLGEPAACRFFLNWFDDASRADMRRELLAEIELALSVRTQAAA